MQFSLITGVRYLRYRGNVVITVKIKAPTTARIRSQPRTICQVGEDGPERSDGPARIFVSIDRQFLSHLHPLILSFARG